jgi:NAD(P)-dependent dehydrogenase (short-subunit alcohol dehydrogenase family)
MGRLQEKTALVIGGTHGMGLATATALLSEGAQVLVTGANPSNVEKAHHALDGRGDAMCSDVSRGEDLEALGRALSERFGLLDALFIFAAVAEFSPFDQVSEESFDRQFAVNTRGAFFAMQRIAPLIRDGGSITTVTVTPGTATPSMSVYMATKGAVRAFSQVLAAELLGRNVRVNCLAPGFITTPTLGVAGLSTEERRELAEIGDLATPMKRHGTVEEIAAAALFLGFDATFTTGIELPVDGGISTVDTPQ